MENKIKMASDAICCLQFVIGDVIKAKDMSLDFIVLPPGPVG